MDSISIIFGGKPRTSMALEKLMSGFNRRVADLQELMVVRADGSRISDFSALNASLEAIEQDLRAVDGHVKSELESLAQAKALHDFSLQQARKIQVILESFPASLSSSMRQIAGNAGIHVQRLDDRPTSPLHASSSQLQKERKGKGAPPRKYISDEELASLSSYMRGRITLDKVNSAIDEMACYAETNAKLIAAPRKKLGDDILDKVLELRDIAGTENVRGKHFFLESDMRGPVLKMDTTGKGILAILRHLGRVSEVRVGKHRVLALNS